MTPHDEFNRDMLWLLWAIKKEALAVPDKIEFALTENKQDVPAVTTQRNLLRCLQGWHILSYKKSESPDILYLTVNQHRFDELYRFFENGLKFDIDGTKLYELANHFAWPVISDSRKTFEAWQIMKGYIKPSQRGKLKSGVPAEPLFKLHPNTTWEDIEIKFKNQFDIEVFLKKKFLQSCDYQELGFFKSRTKDKRPDKQWDFLHALGAIYAIATQQKLKEIPATIPDLKKGHATEAAVMTIKKKLSQQLRAVFGINSDPFEDYDIHGYYKTKFKLTPEPEIRRDHVFEFGESYDDSKLY